MRDYRARERASAIASGVGSKGPDLDLDLEGPTPRIGGLHHSPLHPLGVQPRQHHPSRTPQGDPRHVVIGDVDPDDPPLGGGSESEGRHPRCGELRNLHRPGEDPPIGGSSDGGGGVVEAGDLQLGLGALIAAPGLV